MNDRAVLLVGDELLVEEALERIRAEADVDPLAEAIFEPGAATTDIVSALETPSLLGGRRLVVVHGAHALNKEQVTALGNYLEAPSPHSLLVLVSGNRTKLAEAVERVGSVVNLQAPRGRTLLGWIRRRAGSHGLTLDEGGASAVRDVAGSDLRDIEATLTQLATAVSSRRRVGAADVRAQFPRLADERVYAFTDAVGDRRLAAAMTTLRRLLDQGDEPLVIFGALAGQVRRMLIARSVADAGPRVVGERLGMPEWRAQRLHRQARSYREEELADALGTLAATDVEMKGGDLPPEVALERAVVQIVAPPKP